ncbi:hypothetical protein FOA52_013297 [Chlamydomonas sp. UWO 241]|nr:hypothetical protein FOA52_013297 [Chlamydomonas sp. UWO 241]
MTRIVLAAATPAPRKSHQGSRQGGGAGRKASPPPPPRQQQQQQQQQPQIDLSKEAHKIFDEVFITVRSGNGGAGEVIEHDRGKMVENFKYKPGGNQPKKIFLKASTPGDGSDGADVVIVCDADVDTLVHLHARKEYTGRNGSNSNPATGSAGPKNNAKARKAFTPPLEVRVPPGTVVKRKATGKTLGELVQPGDRIVVAKGGPGGRGGIMPSKEANQRELAKQYKLADEAGAEVVAVEDGDWKVETKGLPGQQLGLHLQLRVVADIGIVGFPNAGKSSLLAAMTRASPEIAPYPFTTLMPNLGVLQSGTGKAGPVLADLPGLIEGAHKGKGLGRMFLRHLRRTRALLHVVDAATEDPATDYWAVREELRMYNPEYVARPHVVALNKMDMEDAGGLREELIEAIEAAAMRHRTEWANEEWVPSVPVMVVPVSALEGEGLDALQEALAMSLDTEMASRREPRASFTSALGMAPPRAGQEGTGSQPNEYEKRLLTLSDDQLLAAAGVDVTQAPPGASDAGADDDEDDGWGAPLPMRPASQGLAGFDPDALYYGEEEGDDDGGGDGEGEGVANGGVGEEEGGGKGGASSRASDDDLDRAYAEWYAARGNDAGPSASSSGGGVGSELPEKEGDGGGVEEGEDEEVALEDLDEEDAWLAALDEAEVAELEAALAEEAEADEFAAEVAATQQAQAEERARTAATGRQGGGHDGEEEAPWGVVTAEERARAAMFAAWEGAGAWEGGREDGAREPAQVHFEGGGARAPSGKEPMTESVIDEAELTAGERELLGLSDEALLELLGDA